MWCESSTRRVGRLWPRRRIIIALMRRRRATAELLLLLLLQLLLLLPPLRVQTTSLVELPWGIMGRLLRSHVAATWVCPAVSMAISDAISAAYFNEFGPSCESAFPPLNSHHGRCSGEARRRYQRVRATDMLKLAHLRHLICSLRLRLLVFTFHCSLPSVHSIASQSCRGPLSILADSVKKNTQVCANCCFFMRLFAPSNMHPPALASAARSPLPLSLPVFSRPHPSRETDAAFAGLDQLP